MDDSDLHAWGVDERQARRALDVIESSVADPDDLLAVKQALGFESYTGMYLTSRNTDPSPIRREAVFQVARA